MSTRLVLHWGCLQEGSKCVVCSERARDAGSTSPRCAGWLNLQNQCITMVVVVSVVCHSGDAGGLRTFRTMFIFMQELLGVRRGARNGNSGALIAEFYLVDRGLRHRLPGFSSMGRLVILP